MRVTLTLPLLGLQPTTTATDIGGLSPTIPYLCTCFTDHELQVYSRKLRYVLLEEKENGWRYQRLVEAEFIAMAHGISLKAETIELDLCGIQCANGNLVGSSWGHIMVDMERKKWESSRTPPLLFLAFNHKSVLLLLEWVSVRRDGVDLGAVLASSSHPIDHEALQKVFCLPVSLLLMEFLSRSSAGDGPLVAFGGSDGVIRVLSMITWKLVRRYTGGHKGSISCLMTFMASSGEVVLSHFLKTNSSKHVMVMLLPNEPADSPKDHTADDEGESECEERRILLPILVSHPSSLALDDSSTTVQEENALLVSGASDGLLVLWSADHGQDSRELVPKLSLKAHDGGVVAVELSRVMGGAPQLITIGADKTLAIWDTVSFKELRRIKPVPKLACHSVASWCHPRAPNLDILTCVKDSHIWAIEHPTYSALTRPLCELSSLVPPQALAPNKKLRVYCMVAHSLQPHLVATGTNIGVILSEFDARSLPAVAPLPTLPGSREHSAVFVVERELKLLNFQLSNTLNPSLGSTGSLSETGRSRVESLEPLHVKQIKKHISTPVPHDSYSILSVSSSGKYLAVVWPDIPYFAIYKVKDWSVVDSGTARLLAWDTCRDRFALLESALPPRLPIIQKGGSSRKAKEAAAAAAQAAAAAATAASAATVEVRILLDDGTSHVLIMSIDGRNEPVIGLHGGALLGVAYRTSRRVSPVAATAISTIQSMPLSGFGNSGLSSFTAAGDAFSSNKSPAAEAAPQNFQLYSWETFQPVSGLLSQPEWTAWDQTVEYCAFAYHQYIVISSLRPQYRYLGDVAIPCATGAVWHRRQLFVATPTTIDCCHARHPVRQSSCLGKALTKMRLIKVNLEVEYSESKNYAMDTWMVSKQSGAYIQGKLGLGRPLAIYIKAERSTVECIYKLQLLASSAIIWESAQRKCSGNNIILKTEGTYLAKKSALSNLPLQTIGSKRGFVGDLECREAAPIYVVSSENRPDVIESTLVQVTYTFQQSFLMTLSPLGVGSQLGSGAKRSVADPKFVKNTEDLLSFYEDVKFSNVLLMDLAEEGSEFEKRQRSSMNDRNGKELSPYVKPQDRLICLHMNGRQSVRFCKGGGPLEPLSLRRGKVTEDLFITGPNSFEKTDTLVKVFNITQEIPKLQPLNMVFLPGGIRQGHKDDWGVGNSPKDKETDVGFGGNYFHFLGFCLTRIVDNFAFFSNPDLLNFVVLLRAFLIRIGVARKVLSTEEYLKMLAFQASVPVCVNSLATNLALYLSTVPLALYFMTIGASRSVVLGKDKELPRLRAIRDVDGSRSTERVPKQDLHTADPRCVFVDAGVAPIDIETKKRKEEMKLKEAQARAVVEHGELALITVDGPQTVSNERISLRPPMLQVVRLASFQHAPSVPPFLTLPKQSKVEGEDSVLQKGMEERRVNEVAVGGGGVSVAVTRFPMEQKRPVGPLVVVGVRDGVLWLIDRYMCAHALSLSHPGIRCRCLAAYGDAVSAVKWASRLGREHHDDLAQFLLGMGYATEALHLPGISKRLEFDLAMQSNDLKRALQCLLTMSNSRDIGQENAGLNVTDILSLTAKQENLVDAVQGIVKFAKEFLGLIDAADATAQADIAREALKRLASAGSVKGALQDHELRGLALRLANHGELTRLSGFVNNLISAGQGREAAFSAAVLGDNALMEKAWQDTGMLAEAVLHAHAHGRPTLKNLVQAWNKMLQKELEHTPSTKTDAAAAFLASLEEPKLTSLAEAGTKPPIEILPPGMLSLSASITVTKKPSPAIQGSQQQSSKPFLLEAAPAAQLASAALSSAVSEPTPAPVSTPVSSSVSDPVTPSESIPAPSESVAPPSEVTAQTVEDQWANIPSSSPVSDPLV
ncbi:hypothetical protein HHK36_023118 [Tetracentron sinense]|uniref:Transducin/WD40 repeat-like superfamily protein n=1 Tax=Tetracentron sinense TaxID=13715 RepID=A0A834YKY5_TETSI|nr:hypothetical protein HHK36_023118 [Tetracentron sinense]